MTKSPGRILIESAEAWNTLISFLNNPEARHCKIPLPDAALSLSIEKFPDGILVHSLLPDRRRRRGVPLPVADRSE